MIQNAGLFISLTNDEAHLLCSQDLDSIFLPAFIYGCGKAVDGVGRKISRKILIAKLWKQFGPN